MPPNPFEAALSQPESDLPYAQLVTLLSVGDFSDPDLPTIAENYLDAFCDPNRSREQRRWIGITLTRMLEKSDCVAHTLRLSEPLKRLGVVMSHEEQGVIKIIAGLIMRQGLAQNIEYHKFWPTEKLADSTLHFPGHPDSGWMRDIHVFLNPFGDSTVSDLDNQSYFGYIASVATSDGFAWAESGNDICAVTLETGLLAIIASDVHLENCHFLDIPVSHIISTRSVRPHDVQTQPTGCESFSVVLSLKSGPWTYCLNSMQRAATEISLVFKHSKDAVQWEDCIKQHQKAYEVHHHISHISSVYTKTSPVRQDRQQKSPCSHSSHSLAEQSGLQKHSEPCHDSLPPKAYAQPRRTSSQTSLQEENTSLSSKFRRIECSKERQTRPSRAAKQNALKKLGSQFNKVDGYGQKDGRQHQTSLAAPGTASSSNGKEVFNDIKSGGLHAGHTLKDDEEYVPTKNVSKKQASTKRKVDLQLIKNGEEMKRSRTSDSYADLTVTAKTERDRLPILMNPFSSASSSRHSLIEGLEASQELVDSDASFKKPTLPAHNARYPSTPTKPKRKAVETQRRLRTPRDARSFYGDIFSQMPSSPSIPCQQDEGVGWSREAAAEAAVLSSNSKPVPASPNAESTAISGHADNDDVALEKQTGDTQIARSDPFTRRSKGGKATSFLRRLTGEEPADVPFDLGTDVSQISPAGNSPRLDAAVTEPLPQLISGRKKTNHPTLAGTQEIDEDLGMESDILNGELRDDQKHSSESDLTSVYFSSSPPRLGSFTSHSSTSATPLSSSHSPLLWSDALEICRETSPEPSQRNLHGLLACTSKEAVRRTVASDSSPSNIEDEFVKDRNCVLQSLLSRDNNDHERVFVDKEAKCEALCEEL